MAKTLHPKPPKSAASPERWTEARVFGLLKGPFPDGAFVRVPQVRNGTGYQGRVRTADALIVSCWPSRGLWFAGVEIKVSKSDWKRELAAPEKADAIQKWCQYWYVAAPAGVVPVFEVPDNWGLIECKPNGCSIVKAAPQLKAKPPDTTFVCAVLRQATASMVSRLELEAMAEERAQEKVKWSARELERLREDVAEFEKAAGVKIGSAWTHGDIAAAVELVRRSKHKGLKHFAERMRDDADRFVKAGCEVMAYCDQVLTENPQ